MSSLVRRDSRRRVRAVTTAAFWLVLASSRSTSAQETVTDVLSFLLTNRSIATGDVVRDEQAATAVRDTLSNFLLLELATLPTVSSSTGFAYRVDRELGGAIVRSSDNFGPFFVERSLTMGRRSAAVHVAYQEMAFDRIDGRPLTDGTLLATAARFRGDLEPFDRETLALRLRTRTVTLSTNIGLTDRLDIAAALPLVRLTLRGERVDTVRGVQFLQATARADTSGTGDLVVSAKYNVVRRGASGLAVGAEGTLPTGAAENLLGAGETSLKPKAIASLERERVAIHSEVGYSFGGLSRELDYGGAVTFVGGPRVTFVGEMLGRRLESLGRLAELVAPHPRLAAVETIRLTGVAEPTHRLMAVGGVKWNVAGTWLLTASVVRPLTSAGLTASVIPFVVAEYSFER
jgi:Putative MetA-pathway of phenol degradation